MTPVRLEPAASRSRVKRSTTEPLRSLRVCLWHGFYCVMKCWQYSVNPLVAQKLSILISLLQPADRDDIVFKSGYRGLEVLLTLESGFVMSRLNLLND